MINLSVYFLLNAFKFQSLNNNLNVFTGGATNPFQNQFQQFQQFQNLFPRFPAFNAGFQGFLLGSAFARSLRYPFGFYGGYPYFGYYYYFG